VGARSREKSQYPQLPLDFPGTVSMCGVSERLEQATGIAKAAEVCAEAGTLRTAWPAIRIGRLLLDSVYIGFSSSRS
jgi:hypothetical protein